MIPLRHAVLLLWFQAFAFSTCVRGAATAGELDTVFRPLPSAGSPFAIIPGSMSVSQRKWLLGVQTNRIVRFRPDGSSEVIVTPLPTASLQSPFNNSAPVKELPDGRLLYSQYIQASRGSGKWNWIRWLPDGWNSRTEIDRRGNILSTSAQSLIVRLRTDGTEDLPYFRASSLEWQREWPLRAEIGPSWHLFRSRLNRRYICIPDSRGRMVIYGEFLSVDGLLRLGVARFAESGKVDPEWNPGPDLGFTDLPGQPFDNPAVGTPGGLVVAGATDDYDETLLLSVYATGAESYRYGVVRVTETGIVTNRFPRFQLSTNDTSIREIIPVPDGGFILSGTIDTSAGVTGIAKFLRDGSLDEQFTVQMKGTNGSLPEVLEAELLADGYLAIDGNIAQVDGVSVPGLARILVFPAVARPPEVRGEPIPLRIAPGEALQLNVTDQSYPLSMIQWWKDGLPITGATNSGFYPRISDANDTSGYEVVVANELGTNRITFGVPELSLRSQVPGSFENPLGVVVQSMSYYVLLRTAPDLTIWMGGRSTNEVNGSPVLAHLLRDGRPDPSFGTNGVVFGNGQVDAIVPLSDGGALIGGRFTRLAGVGCEGLLEVDANGRPRQRSYPKPDTNHITALLALDDGGFLLAGKFQTMNGQRSPHLVRLRGDYSLDPSFSSPFRVGGDIVFLTAQKNNWLVGGYFSTSSQTSPRGGLIRIFTNGLVDVSFTNKTYSQGQSALVTPDGGIVVLTPELYAPSTLVWLNENGDETSLSRALGGAYEAAWFQPGRQIVLTRSGKIVVRSSHGSGAYTGWRGILRFNLSGREDIGFNGTPWSTPRILNTHDIVAIDARADGAVVACGYRSSRRWQDSTNGAWHVEPDDTRILILQSDSDDFLSPSRPEVGDFSVELATQPGKRYQILKRDSLTSLPIAVQDIEGDGYTQTLKVKSGSEKLFLELRRR